ncbi:MAG: transglycosylase SLT domain-containing protein [bacterium]|nr:transglycosylase SLT domain-containing protein [bacterium]
MTETRQQYSFGDIGYDLPKERGRPSVRPLRLTDPNFPFDPDKRALFKKIGLAAGGAATAFAAAKALGIKPWEMRDVSNALGQTSDKIPQSPAFVEAKTKTAEAKPEQKSVHPGPFEMVFGGLSETVKTKARQLVDKEKEAFSSNPGYELKSANTLRWTQTIGENAARVDFPQELISGMVFIESGGDQKAVNRRSGARGIAQLMKPTAREYGLEVDEKVDEREDPVKSLKVASDYLEHNFEHFGDLGLTIWAYHAGPWNVYEAIRKYSADVYHLDPGSIISEDPNTALTRIELYRRLVKEHGVNIFDLYENRMVKQEVLSDLGDETERYVYRAVAASELLQPSLTPPETIKIATN